jgi:hypothetical protein
MIKGYRRDQSRQLLSIQRGLYFGAWRIFLARDKGDRQLRVELLDICSVIGRAVNPVGSSLFPWRRKRKAS